MYQRILAAVDLTPNENAARDHARELAKLTGAAAYLLHVAQLQVVPGEMFGEGLGVGAGADVEIRWP